MNETIKTIVNHRSIRKFKPKQLSQEEIDTIIHAASYASSSSYLMAYSIIGVTDQDKKQALANISGQPYIAENGHFLIFCADYHRHMLHASNEDKELIANNVQSTEYFMIATVDATIAAQNAALAAESLGLGICYIGSIKRDMDKIDELFGLPDHVIPLFGLAIGYPDEEPEQKPRLPKDAVYFENHYPTDQNQAERLTEFDRTIHTYYQTRTTNKRSDQWTKQVIKHLKNPRGERLTPYIKEKKFNTK
ncbi:oxygen-insensitive NADPH nitroreductase [Amphibacillus sediminis]|uniref:oxygen-insensitive NADPH nitroreductase n=1 Tax=Amphibacillus sediminis TaxID=360185 RepID=UPI00082ED472|nr:oxygen-insensitive NADPH nitroreductase [Amphibacillus sediminis]